ncbi:MAG: hypothetical protein Q4B01_04920 [Eubacteriales bacterium]|nr:hypothetical protein [Eubacteriales bacterium]
MKKGFYCKLLSVFFLVLVLQLSGAGITTAAAPLTNVTKAPEATEGEWVIAAKGYRYRFKSNKKYAKNRWMKVGAHIYYFKKNGYLQTGWKTYRGKKYYFSDQGTLVTGWHKINGARYYFWKADGSMATGKVEIAGSTYYFNKKGVMKKGWRKIGGHYYYFYKKNGSMAVNTIVDGYRVDHLGRRVVNSSDTPEPTTTGKVDILVGDSRTVGLGSATGTSGKTIALVGSGYSWWVSTARARLKQKLNSHKTATVVLNFGVNDIDNCDKYISSYRSLMKSYPNARIYIMSVNPIDAKYNWGYYSYSQLSQRIKTFNKKMKAAFPNNYLDCHSHLVRSKFSTVDGIHYTADTYKKIYQFILQNV